MTRTAALRSLVLPGILSLFVLAVLIVLGTWQLQRLAWKENLISMVAARIKETPRLLPSGAEALSMDLANEEYRPYLVEGRFLHRNEVQVYTVLSDAKGMHSGAGYWVLTPLERSDGSIVIINRGFVPPDRKDPASRPESQEEGLQRVSGLLRAPEQANYFTPANDPAHQAWYRRDPAEIARAFGLKGVLPFLLDATGSYRKGALPQPNETRVAFTNNHLGYALTWYGLACTLIGVFCTFAWQRIRESR